ncbi:LysR family transcriptional regulator, partial [Escherichia coli]|nr:LysR family transcriptional regulator [Escherichia coli]
MKLPPLRAVHCFEVVARNLSFSLAAEELNVTQSAVSHQIRLLEDYLGESLFIR